MASINIPGVGDFQVSDRFLSLPQEEQQEAVKQFLEQREAQASTGAQPEAEGDLADTAVGTLRSFLGQGVALGFGDEIEAFIASRVKGTKFDDEQKRIRDELETFRQQSPVLAFGSELAGAFVLPGGAALRGGTAVARAARSAGVGGVTGAAVGAGTSEGDITTAEGLLERAEDAATGAATGAAVGAAAPAVTSGAARVARAVRRGGRRAAAALSPERQAQRQVAEALETDLRAGQTGLRPSEMRQAAAEGLPVANVDVGGRATRGLARTAANVDDEAQAIVERATSDRFAGQGARTEEFINDLFGGGVPNAELTRLGVRANVDSFARAQQLQSAARRIRGPAYRRAFQAGDRPISTPEIQRLISAPAIETAIKRAAINGRNRAVADGFGDFNPNINIDAVGIEVLRRTNTGRVEFPNLRFWDLVKRELDDMSRVARRQGADGEASAIEQITRQLRNELDEVVPEYARARGAASTFFGAEDALAAGQNFARSNRFRIGEARQRIRRMNPAERELFAEGFADELITKINRASDRQDVVRRVFGNEDARRRMRVALGNQRANLVEARMRIEGIMDLSRGAVSGNSTTARQLIQAGAVGGGAGLLTGDPVTGIATALTFRGAQRLRNRRQQNVARRVARMLMSQDPGEISRAVRIVAGDRQLLRNIRRFDAATAKALSQQAVSDDALGLQGEGE